MHSIEHIAWFGFQVTFILGIFAAFDFLHHFIGYSKKAIALGMVGILLISINLAVISPMVMEQTEEALSTATVRNEENTWGEDVDVEDWRETTTERSFYAWNLTNSESMIECRNDASIDCPEMEFEKMGPFTYEMTTKREFLSHNPEMGTLTYREYNVYEWSGGLSGDTQLTNLNILFNTQKIGAAGNAIDYGSSFVKGAYTRDMLYTDLSERAPSIWTSDDIAAAGHESMMAEIGWGGNEIANTTLQHVMYGAKDPGDDTVCIALTCDIGPMMMIRGGAPDNGTNSIARATLFGYLAMGEFGIDENMTYMLDELIYNAVNARFIAHGGGANLESASKDDLNDRLEEMTGWRIEHEPTLQNLLFSEGEGGVPTGILVCDDRRILCGSTDFLLKADEDPWALKNELTIDPQHTFNLWALQEIGGWAGDWFLADKEYEMILSGGTGKIDANEWFLEAFGSIDPINHEYIALGLNVGSEEFGAPLWSVVYGNELIDLEPEVTATLFDESNPHRITGGFAQDFLYGEIMGYSVPMDENFIPTAGGTVHEWNDSFVAQIYGLDNNSASALRWLFSFTVFDTFLEPLLESFLDVMPYRTQSVNNWLFGWLDPIAGPDATPGWVSLEKNATYYGCQYTIVDEDNDGQDDDDGLGSDCWTDSASVYTVYTGAVGNHEPGQIMLEDGDIHLPWRTPSRNASAYGMLDPVIQNGAVGSYFPANSPATANLGGYAVATSEITGTGSVQGIETQTHTFTVDPLENPIQAKLLDQESILDIFPGALPVYFGGEVVMEMEPNVNAAIAGEMNSYFYLDTRGIGATDPTMDDLQPVFQISQSSSMTEEQSGDFKSAVYTNMKPYSYWTNFDTDGEAMYIDQITFVIWLLAITSLLGCSYTAKTDLIRDEDEFEIYHEEE